MTLLWLVTRILRLAVSFMKRRVSSSAFPNNAILPLLLILGCALAFLPLTCTEPATEAQSLPTGKVEEHPAVLASAAVGKHQGHLEHEVVTVHTHTSHRNTVCDHCHFVMRHGLLERDRRWMVCSRKDLRCIASGQHRRTHSPMRCGLCLQEWLKENKNAPCSAVAFVKKARRVKCTSQQCGTLPLLLVWSHTHRRDC